MQERENRIRLDNFEQNIGLGLNKINNCTQNALFTAISGSPPESVPIRIRYEPETALDLSVADKKGAPKVVSDIEATQGDPWQQYQLANIRSSRLPEAIPAQTTPPYGPSIQTTSYSSQNLLLSGPPSASLWSLGLGPGAGAKTDPNYGQLSHRVKKIRLEGPIENQRRFSAPTGPAGATSLAPSPAKSGDESPSNCHQYEYALSQRLPQIHPNVFSLLAASSYERSISKPDVRIGSDHQTQFQQAVGLQNGGTSTQIDRLHQPANLLFKLKQQPQGANALDPASQEVPIMQQRRPAGAQDVNVQSSAVNHLHNLNTTLEMVQAKIGKDHKLIPILRKMSFRCHVCGSCFEDRHRLQQHLSIHLQLHPSWFEERTIKDTMAKYESRRGDYLCTICHLRHDTTAEFDKHMQLHGERPHQCELCLNDNKTVSFRFFRQLLTHLRTHCFIYNCRFVPDCKQTANRKDYLKLHILKHHLNNKLSDRHVMAARNMDNLGEPGMVNPMV